MSMTDDTGAGGASPANEREPGVAITRELDACGLQCPGLVMSLAAEVKTLKEWPGDSDHHHRPGFATDICSWCQSTGHTPWS